MRKTLTSLLQLICLFCLFTIVCNKVAIAQDCTFDASWINDANTSSTANPIPICGSNYDGSTNDTLWIAIGTLHTDPSYTLSTTAGNFENDNNQVDRAIITYVQFTQADINASNGTATITFTSNTNTECTAMLEIDFATLIGGTGNTALNDFCTITCGNDVCEFGESYCSCADCDCATEIETVYIDVSGENAEIANAGDEGIAYCNSAIFEAENDGTINIALATFFPNCLGQVDENGVPVGDQPSVTANYGTILNTSTGDAMATVQDGSIYWLSLTPADIDNAGGVVNLVYNNPNDANCSYSFGVDVAAFYANGNEAISACLPTAFECALTAGTTVSLQNCLSQSFELSFGTMNASNNQNGVLLVYDVDPSTTPSQSDIYADLANNSLEDISSKGEVFLMDLSNGTYPIDGNTATIPGFLNASCEVAAYNVYLVPVIATTDENGTVSVQEINSNCAIEGPLTVVSYPAYEISVENDASCLPSAHLYASVVDGDAIQLIDCGVTISTNGADCTNNFNYDFSNVDVSLNEDASILLSDIPESCILGDLTGTLNCACASACAIISVNSDISDCDTGTDITDDTDDTFTFTLAVNGNEFATTVYNYSATDNAGNMITGSATYGETTTLGPFLINNWTNGVAITLTDSNSATCTATATITPPATCSANTFDCATSVGSSVSTTCSGEPFAITLGTTNLTNDQDGFVLVYDLDLSTQATQEQIYNATKGEGDIPSDLDFLGISFDGQGEGETDITNLEGFENESCSVMQVGIYIVPANLEENLVTEFCAIEGPLVLSVYPNFAITTVGNNSCLPMATLQVLNAEGVVLQDCDTQGGESEECTNDVNYDFSDIAGEATCVSASVTGTLSCNCSCENPPNSGGDVHIDLCDTDAPIDLEDFIGADFQGGFFANTASTIINPAIFGATTLNYEYIMLADSDLCDNDMATFTVTISATSNTTESATICAGETYTSTNNLVYAAEGTYTENMTNDNGCDATNTIVIMVNTAQDVTESATICAGEIYIASSGTEYATSGAEVVTDSNGCDYTLNVILDIKAAVNTVNTGTICDDGSSVFVSFTGNVYNQAGEYAETFTDTNGCEATNTVIVVEENCSGTCTNVEDVTESVIICAGETYIASTGTEYTTSGSEVVTDGNGCSYVVTVNLTVQTPVPATISTDVTEVCVGEAMVNVMVEDSGTGDNSIFVITDESNTIILATSTSAMLDLSGAPEGVCNVWLLNYYGDLNLPESSFLADLEVCGELSNPVAVNRTDCTPVDCGTFAVAVSGDCDASNSTYTLIITVNNDTNEQFLIESNTDTTVDGTIVNGSFFVGPFLADTPYQYTITSVSNSDCTETIESSGFSCTTTAVELLNFDGRMSNNTNELFWTTATEIENDYFILESSLDGYSFATIATLQGAGTSAMPNHYSFVDTDVVASTNYYRLRTVDTKGNTEIVSDIIELSRTTDLTIEVYPIPASEMLNIDLGNSAENINVSILDITGKLVETIKIDNTNALYSLDITHLNTGAYFITINSDGKLASTKFIKH